MFAHDDPNCNLHYPIFFVYLIFHYYIKCKFTIFLPCNNRQQHKDNFLFNFYCTCLIYTTYLSMFMMNLIAHESSNYLCTFIFLLYICQINMFQHVFTSAVIVLILQQQLFYSVIL